MYEIDVKNDEIQKLQDSFCKSNNIYLMCVSKLHGPFTDFSGSKLEKSFVEQFFTSALQKEIADNFFDGGLEDIVEKRIDTEYVMINGIAIRGKRDEVIGLWLSFAIDGEKIPDEAFVPAEVKRTDALSLDKSLHLLSLLTSYFLKEKFNSSSLLEKLSAEQDCVRLMEHRLMKNEIMTEILRMMESENSFSKISEDILKEAGQYIGSSHVCLLKLAPDEVTVDMIAEWCHAGFDSLIKKSQGMDIKTLPFMNGKPYTISSDSVLPDDFAKYFNENGIDAGLFLPIEINEQTGMYLLFLSLGQQRKWSVDDIRFANDIKRVIHTILIKRITKNSLASSYSALEAILQRAGCGVAVVDVVRHQTLYENDTFKLMFENEIDRLSVEEIIFDSDENLKNITGYSANGAGKWYSITYSAMTWVDGRQVRLNTFFDVSELKQYQKRMEKQSSLDMLTGLYNRQSFERDLEAQLHFVEKTEKNFAAVLIDLADFSNVNEGLGHGKGDLLLKYIAKTINGISVINDKCYRVGGDEFAILVSYDIYDKLDFVIKRISSLFEHSWTVENQEFECAMSMAIVRMPEDAKTSDEVLNKLAATLSVAKAKGKNVIEFYDHAIDATREKLAKEENIFKNAAMGNMEAFEVYFQPVYKLLEDENICLGAEALVRFNHEKKGFMEACDFIDTLEKTELIIPIGEKVLNAACKTLKHWNDFGHPDYRMNVNISTTQLIKTDFINTLNSVLLNTAVDPKNLFLEISDDIASENYEQVMAVLTQINALGVEIALDNFGQGLSSLELIRKTGASLIKIDSSFVKDIKSDSFSKAVIGSLAELGNSLSIDICAVGIENEEQLATLKQKKINLAQGYYLDKPMTKAEFEAKFL